MSEFEYFKPGLGMKTGSDIREASHLNEGFWSLFWGSRKPLRLWGKKRSGRGALGGFLKRLSCHCLTHTKLVLWQRCAPTLSVFKSCINFMSMDVLSGVRMCPCGGQKRASGSLELQLGWLWATTWTLRTNPEFSAKARSTLAKLLSHLSTTPAPQSS